MQRIMMTAIVAALVGGHGEVLEQRVTCPGTGALCSLISAVPVDFTTLSGSWFLIPGSWSLTHDEDPADSIYRAARSAMNRGEYGRAADLFRQISDRFPKSAYAGDALYWQGFALYRRAAGDDDLRNAVTALETQAKRYPKAGTRGDAEALLVRIRGELARRGDEGSGRRIAQDAGRVTTRCPADDDDDDMRIAALNALQQMDDDQALPILREVLARRDACSVALRRKAVFLVAQTNTEEGGEVLVRVIGSDPDAEVRRQAVFWLSEVPGDRAVAVLDSILRNSKDGEIQEKAIFALSQHESARARQILHAIAEGGSMPEELRAQAIFAIGHHSGKRADGVFLRDLYPRLTSETLKEAVIQAAAQVESADVSAWLLSLASNSSEPLELRKKALFWGGQNVRSVTELIKLYSSMTDTEMREQLIWVMSDRNESAALEKLIDIAKNENNRELRKKAIFWLGQKNDPRVKKILLEIINQ